MVGAPLSLVETCAAVPRAHRRGERGLRPDRRPCANTSQREASPRAQSPPASSMRRMWPARLALRAASAARSRGADCPGCSKPRSLLLVQAISTGPSPRQFASHTASMSSGRSIGVAPSSRAASRTRISTSASSAKRIGDSSASAAALAASARDREPAALPSSSNCAHVELAVVEQIHVGGAIGRIEAAARDELVDILVALIVAHVDNARGRPRRARSWRILSSCARAPCVSSASTCGSYGSISDDPAIERRARADFPRCRNWRGASARAMPPPG